MESKGLPLAIAREVLVTRFNDPDMLEELFRRTAGEVACFIVEPFMGSGGFLFAEPEFLAAGPGAGTRYGALLIFDEVICGFRFCAGAVSPLFGVQPDLATFAKVMGGGMPVAAVAGRAELMKLAGRGGGVKFSGGTYSGHPASMLASTTMMEHLVATRGRSTPAWPLSGSDAAAPWRRPSPRRACTRCAPGTATRPSRAAPWPRCISPTTRRASAPRSRPATPTSAT